MKHWHMMLLLLLVLAQSPGLASTTPASSGSLNDLSGLKSVLQLPGELHLVVPHITPWSLRLTEWRGGQRTIYYIPRTEAQRYCGSANVPIRVLPGTVRVPVGFLVGQGGTLDGVVLRGRGLVEDPGWAENDWIALWMGLSGAPLPGRSWVEGSWTGVLTARIELQVTERYLGSPETTNFLFNHVWNGQVLDVRVQGYDAHRIYNGETLPLVQADGTVRGDCTLRSITTRVELGVDTSRTVWRDGPLHHNLTFAFDPTSGLETFRALEHSAHCGWFGCTWRGFNIYDLQGRRRGWGEGWQCGAHWCTTTHIHPLMFDVRKTHEEVTTRIRPWRERTVWQPQGTFSVEPGGIVRVGGQVWQIPGLEMYGLRPEGVGIEWVRGEPLVSYLAQASGIMGGAMFRGQVMDLADFCANVR